ncbi:MULTISPECIES: hypothetical protein [Desulfitobacterium]|uniref:Uncharacterized protein n=1 Tax=Desulfitobacterium hafniense DP7 TaxID=537010 RepID=G9XJ84_DESHA|nr:MULTISPECIES: hypothetical protein [Desulfitobacterium]EHL08252.1 hypothetical protein HMPREF0322_01010 [Desulfitobacterium hafniense DP7]
MLKPSEVKKAAKMIEADNFRFRSFLKNRADEDELEKAAGYMKLTADQFKEFFLGSTK